MPHRMTTALMLTPCDMDSPTLSPRSSASALIQALHNPACYPHPVKRVYCLETHSSWVLLAGRYAYKIKKPLNLGFLNYSTLALRLHDCQEELRLNQRLAAKLYLGVISIGGSAQQPILGAEPSIEYAVKMRRFAANQQLTQQLRRNQLLPQHIDAIAIALARFHRSLPATEDKQFASAALLQAQSQQSFEQLQQWLPADSTASLPALAQRYQQVFTAITPLFAQRQAQGFIRECHGDLHLGNWAFINGKPTAFDGISFNPALRWIDVINDLAFLMMDLLFYGRSDWAYRLLNRYLEDSGDYDGLALLPFYLSSRALVRAKVAALQAAPISHCHAYLALAQQCLTPHSPQLVITHGLPGSGKTTLSQQLLQGYPCIRIRSDVERKRIAGLSPLARSNGTLYSSAHTQQTYQRLYQISQQLLTLGYSVVVDAAFLRQTERLAFQTLAQQRRLGFYILDIHAAVSTLRQRLAGRINDASEADVTVLETLRHCDEPLSPAETAYAITLSNHDDAGKRAIDRLIQRLLQTSPQETAL